MAFHINNGFTEITFSEMLKDVKHFLNFLSYFTSITPPKIDLTIQNYSLWNGFKK